MEFNRSVAGGIGIALTIASVVSAQSSSAPAQKPHRCATAALARAPKLLAFHFGPDSRIEIDNDVRGRQQL